MATTWDTLSLWFLEKLSKPLDLLSVNLYRCNWAAGLPFSF